MCIKWSLSPSWPGPPATTALEVRDLEVSSEAGGANLRHLSART